MLVEEKPNVLPGRASSGEGVKGSWVRHGWRDVKNLGRCYLQLGKHKLSSLVVYTSVVGYVMGSAYGEEKGFTNMRKFASMVVGTGLCAASANALNQVYEAGRDALMSRTRARPLPSGRMSSLHALLFATGAGVFGSTILAKETNETTATLGLVNIALYAGVYTPLKVLHPINTWIGAVVGAIPPLIGWSAATNGDLSHPGAWLLAGTLFTWQIPHFHALAAMSAEDYKRGGYKMLAQVEPKLNARLAAGMAYSLLPLGPLVIHSGMATPWFAVEAFGLNMWMIYGAEKFVQKPTDRNTARLLFRASISYLPIVLSLMLFHRRPEGTKYPTSETDADDRSDEKAKPYMLAPFPFLPCPQFHPAALFKGIVQHEAVDPSMEAQAKEALSSAVSPPAIQTSVEAATKV